MTLTDFAIVDSGVDTWCEKITFRIAAHRENFTADHGAQGCRNISMTPRGHLSLLVLRHSKEWTCVWWIWKLHQPPAHVAAAPNSRPLVLCRVQEVLDVAALRQKVMQRASQTSGRVGAACLMGCFAPEGKRNDRDGSRVPHDP